MSTGSARSTLLLSEGTQGKHFPRNQLDLPPVSPMEAAGGTSVLAKR